MNPIVFHLVSGDAFFSGLLCFTVAASLSLRTKFRNSSSSLCFLIGAILIFFSTTPLHILFYAVLVVASTFWLIGIRKKSASDSYRKKTSIGFLIVCIIAGVYAATFHLLPKSESRSYSLIVIGDSVSAGVTDRERTWVDLVRDEGSYQVLDLSLAGAKVGDAVELVNESKIPPGIVLVEIGGNDLFSDTTPEQFHDRLDELLSLVATEEREVWMFELPLPPLQYQIGWSQRKLARQYKVKLIPRRRFLSILADRDATLDSIHLSPQGHQRMAKFVESLLQTKTL